MSSLPRCWAQILTAVLVLTACGCTQIQVRSDHNPRADFSRLQTYAWLPDVKPTSDPRLDSALLDRRIRGAVERNLASKGYQRLDEGTPSFRVAYHIYLQRRTQDVVEPVGPYGYRWWGGMATTRTYQYDQGTLLLDVVDPLTNELMWRGDASAIVDPRASVKEREERIERAVRTLLERFPPG